MLVAVAEERRVRPQAQAAQAAVGLGGQMNLEELVEPQTQVEAAVGQVTELRQGLVDLGVLALLFLNIHQDTQSPTLAVVLPTQLQHRVALALQPLLPEPAMSLGVKHGTLRIS
jgi:hypothetical protein